MSADREREERDRKKERSRNEGNSNDDRLSESKNVDGWRIEKKEINSYRTHIHA